MRRLKSAAALLALATLPAAWLAVSRLDAAERGRIPPSIPVEDPHPDPAPPGPIIVAVIDTGVDADHPALKGKVLPGINLGGGEGTADHVGHGTAVAGLIAADHDDPRFDGVCVGLDVKILPIKVTPLSEVEAVPTLVGVAVERAVKAGAQVICVAMGGPRSTESLENALKLAEEKGVIVVAAAGMDDGSHDLYPAAHPWAVSATVCDKGTIVLPDGKEKTVIGPAEMANISGKTEIMGAGSADVISPEGGTGRLEGSSVPCARAAGLAATLRAIMPALDGKRIRQILVNLGTPPENFNEFPEYPVRRADFDMREICTQLTKPGRSDLALSYGDIRDFGSKEAPDLRFVGTILNLGTSPLGGRLHLSIPELKVDSESTFDAIPPGGSAAVTLPVRELGVGGQSYQARIQSDQDVNPANDSLNCLVPKLDIERLPHMRRLRISGWKSPDSPLQATFDLVNPTCVNQQVTCKIHLSDKVWESHVTLAPREKKTATTTIEIPGFGGNVGGVRIDALLWVGEEHVSGATTNIRYREKPYRLHYADTWLRKEFIFDAPAFVKWGHPEIPILLFAPEIQTRLDGDDICPRYPESPADPQLGRQYLVHRVRVEQLSGRAAYSMDGVDLPDDESTTHRVLFDSSRASDLRSPTASWKEPHCYVESWCGEFEDPRKVTGLIQSDGWHQIIVVPHELLDFADDSGPPGQAPAVYFYCQANTSAATVSRLPLRELDSDASLLQRGTRFSAVLRVQWNVQLPNPLAGGRYYDVHVHTASEFSRDALEPRLAFGGPPWMIARCAHAMGFIDDRELALIRWNVHPYTRPDYGDRPVPRGQDQLIVTTDHNCFLTDTDAPTAYPYGYARRFDKEGRRFLDSEIDILRRYFGQGANQELSLAVLPQRPLGAAHGLVYGAEPLEGPWHGGRSLARTLMTVREILEVLPWADKAAGVLKNVPGVPRWIQMAVPHRFAHAVFKALKTGLEVRETSGPTRDALKEVQAYAKKRGLELSNSGIRDLVREIGSLSFAQFEELLAELVRLANPSLGQTENNTWTVEKTEYTLTRQLAAYIAAHPFLDGGLHWEEAALRRAANLHPRAQKGDFGAFPFKGVQIWNEPKFAATPVASPESLNAINIWKIGYLVDRRDWHAEFMHGFFHYVHNLAMPGLRYAFEAPEGLTGIDASRVRSTVFTRKLYHYAGSDAHGAFNYTTGCGGTVLTHPFTMKVAKVFQMGHGGGVNTSHFGAARVYAEEASLDAFLQGRCVCTDGPVVWPELDANLKLNSRDLVWHDSWVAPSQAGDDDGKMGGEGTFDGGRTALVAKDCPNMVLRYRAAPAWGQGDRVKLVEVYTATGTRELRRMTDLAGVDVPVAEISARPGDGDGVQFLPLQTLAPSETSLLILGGFTSATGSEAAAAGTGFDGRFGIRERRCFANPIWISTVEITGGVRPVWKNGSTVVPPFCARFRFKTDRSMNDKPYVVYLKQFTREGDSTALTVRLYATPEKILQETGGNPARLKAALEAKPEGASYWADVDVTPNPFGSGVADCIMNAVNLEEFPFGEPWYPVEGTVTYAVILVAAEDAFGNVLNPVASKVSASVPAKFEPPIDPDSRPDPAPASEQRCLSDGGDAVAVNVREGDTLSLPKGATHGDRRIPPGDCTVTKQMLDEGAELAVPLGAQTVTLVLTRDPAPAETIIVRTGDNWTGTVPVQPGTPAEIAFKNRDNMTFYPAEIAAQAPGCAVFTVPDGDPGRGELRVTQNGKAVSHPIEAVCAAIRWDSPEASRGETRKLLVEVSGTASPKAWLVSGSVRVANGRVARTAGGVACTAQELTLGGLPGDVGWIADVVAEQAGQMVATARLRVRRK